MVNFVMTTIFSFYFKLYENKTSRLAPIEVKILLCRGSAQKIETDSGTSGLLKPKFSAPEKTLESFLNLG
jgi:hypothetical protein